MTTEPRPELLKIPAVGAILGGISRATVYALLRRGELRLVHIGKSAFVPRESVEEYLARINEEGAARQARSAALLASA